MMPRTVIVVGGGPARLEAARVAALRGHRVTLLECKTGLGGKIVGAALAPTHGELARVIGIEGERSAEQLPIGCGAPHAAAVVWVGQQRVDTALASALAQRGFRAVQTIGEAYAPRRLLSAIEEGHLAGRRV